MATIKQKSLSTLARVETQVPEIAQDHIYLLQAVNPKYWENKSQAFLENVIYGIIRHLRMNVMNTRQVRGGEAFTQGIACLNVMLHCYSQERPVVHVSISPTCKEYGIGY